MAVIKVFSRSYFFQQVRVMLRKLSRVEAGHSEPEEKQRLLEEQFQFVSPLSLDAPKGEVGEVSKLKHQQGWQVEVCTQGLTGALGAMPTAYTEWLIERYYRYGDRAGKAFIDIFNHRLHTLRFLAWQKYHFYASHEFNGVSLLTLPVRALSGVLQSSARMQQEEYAGLFSQSVRSLVCLEQWLQHRFSLPVQIQPFVGRWSALETSDCCQLGNARQTLSQSPAIGAVFWDRQTYFTIQLGPLSQQDARSFLTLGQEYQRFLSHVRDYVGIGLDFGLDLLIENQQSAATRLGSGELGFDICLGPQMAPEFRRVSLPVNLN
ncbi:type VI secretion system baseplate subunit TssG [Hafnia paralvei]|uniref:Type VI secretion system baseplate subunit TssG n=1 Tax=Hafnia paralvei TaxID=546367 RepID=A0A4Q9EH57_9GAMM|nr:type VI secretion system baseplate subunit TssG [Hafnia paralvei]TBM23064.1 type VI secretion system baseplate subunit TssG [Hafnia paralvei]